MDDFGDQVQGARTLVVEGQAAGGRRKGRAKSRDPSQAREEMGDVEARLAKVELHLINGDERFEELGYRLLELVEVMEETREEMQATLNETIDKLASDNEALKIAHTEEISATREENWLLKEEVDRMAGEMKDVRRKMMLLRKMVAQGVGGSFNPSSLLPTTRVEEALFSFKDELQTWVKLEIERRGAQNLAIAIAITESFVEFKKMDRSKGRDGRDSKGKNWGDKGGSKEGGNKEGLREGNAKRERFKKEDSKDGKFKNFDKFSKPGERLP
ncbi:hypothetical protein GH714_007989 [Hevea brasiliensis]|uniref:Uncharacterized protein n=1 Tax=Hevea brasiliensis TaxID=3981 RepID=A0A6A6N9T4_HEVBR|nr:hypothetical protein GH714_007989 [Hevea brasiliensis]